MSATVGIVDYHSGNIRSVANAVEHAGGTVVHVQAATDLAGCTHVILPGVGAFGFCSEQLHRSGLLPALEQWAMADGRPLLGICVGMQLLADYSEEHGKQRGLGWIGGAVRRLDNGGDESVRIPHVGWNEVLFTDALGDFTRGERANFYFDHSYAYEPSSSGAEVGRCEHGRAFSAVIRRDNLLAAQFHPEKSQTQGMRLLQAFFAT